MDISARDGLNMKKGIKLSFMFENNGAPNGSYFEVRTPDRVSMAKGVGYFSDTTRFEECTGLVDILWTYKGTNGDNATEEAYMEGVNLSPETLKEYYTNGDKKGTKLLMQGADRLEGRDNNVILYGYDGNDYFYGSAKKMMGGNGNDTFDMESFRNDLVINGGSGKDTYFFDYSDEEDSDVDELGVIKINKFEKGAEKVYLHLDHDNWWDDINFSSLRLKEKNGRTQVQYIDDDITKTLISFKGVTGLELKQESGAIGDVGLSGWANDSVARTGYNAVIV